MITRIPTHHNDGSKINATERRELLRQVRDLFGGYSLEGPFQGSWVAEVGHPPTCTDCQHKIEATTPDFVLALGRRGRIYFVW